MKIAFFILVLFSGGWLYGAPPFRFHLSSEPSSLKPWEQKNSMAGYLITQVSGTLLSYQNQKLSGNLAETCTFQSALKIRCELRKNLKWSDGTNLVANDFVRGFQNFLKPEHKSFRADLLFSVKNARKVFSGELKLEELGVRAPKTDRLEIELERADSDFLYTLANPLLFPVPESGLPGVEALRKNPSLWKSSGPYSIETWNPQKKIVLKNNSSFWKQKSRPAVEVFWIQEDSVALNLYEKNELSLLRRLPTALIPKFRSRNDFVEVDQFRFDYLGFSSKWKSQPQFRKSLAQALRYTELQNLFQSRGRPGCPGFPERLSSEKICLEWDLKSAKNFWAKVREKPARFEVMFSKQGGDDHKRSMEWIQSEWQQHLGFAAEVSGLENKIFVDRLEKNPPDLFRKGVAPDRPTCVAALETFESTNPENYLRFQNPNFDDVIQTLRTTSSQSKKQKLCAKALHLLIDDAFLIPTGAFAFTLLVRPEWTDWRLNELNHLDLSDLEWKK